jgi:caa(3)-type oxidase subunit IV
MNNPPDISPVEHETEEYAHEVRRHVRGYLMVGGTLLLFTAVTVALSYVNFGTQKANVAVALLVATFKAGLVAAIFMHLSAEKRLIYRILIFTGFFVFGLFWLTYLAWYDLSKVFTSFLSSSQPCSHWESVAIAFGSI